MMAELVESAKNVYHLRIDSRPHTDIQIYRSRKPMADQWATLGTGSRKQARFHALASPANGVYVSAKAHA